MPRPKRGPRLGGSASHQKAILSKLALELFWDERGTTTITKAKMLRNRPRAALLAGGIHVSGPTDLTLHREPGWFDRAIRDQERSKYPPARALLAAPFHRRLLWWYVGRVEIGFDDPTVEQPGGADRARRAARGPDEAAEHTNRIKIMI